MLRSVWCSIVEALDSVVDTTQFDIAGLELDALKRLLGDLAIEPYRARQIYRWIHRRGVSEFDRMTDLSRRLRDDLASRFTVATPRIITRDASTDGTVKFLLGLADDHRIESVYIPDTPSQTFCLSTQVGCAMRCAFCLTGTMGILRNLTAGEIVGQVRVLGRELGLLEHPFNIVLMGMGEPLDNYDNTMQALRMLVCEQGAAVPPRRITLSTVGVLPAMNRLAKEAVMPNLAVSLHATTDAQRERLVPLDRKYRLEDLLAACRAFPLKRRSRITFEYVLIRNVNDSPEDALRLVKLLAGMRAKVNLIPLNAAAGIPFDRPSSERVDRFGQMLADHHLTVSVRKSRGRDIRAACGQLIVDGPRQSPAQRLATRMGSESPSEQRP